MAEGQARWARHRRAATERRTGTRVLALALLGVGLVSATASADPCAPWPGEPDPLPRLNGDGGAGGDEMLERWARLRVLELSLAARSLEDRAPARARQLWRRVLCFDPADEGARAGIEQTPMVAVHRPPLVTREEAARSDADAWEELSEALYVSVPAPPPPPRPRPRPQAPKPAPAPDSADFDRALATLESQVHAAQFEAALETAEQGREAAQALGSDADAEREARLEVLAATAALALGRAEAAESSFARALDADPDLTLDPVSTPPKVRRALERARQARQR